jgi:hypothetical protein
VVDALDQRIRPQCQRVAAHTPIVTAMNADLPALAARVPADCP